MDTKTSVPTLYQSLIDALQQQNREKLADIFRAHPNAALENAVTLLGAQQHVYDLAALDAMAGALTHGGRFEEGRDFASAVLIWGVHLWSSDVTLPEGELEYYLGNCSYLIQKSLLDSGHFDLAVNQYEIMQGLQLPGWGNQVFIATHLQAAENYLENNQADSAQEIVNSIQEAEVLPAATVLYDRLKNKLKLLKVTTQMSHEEVEAYKKMQKLEDLKKMLAAIKVVMKGYEHEMDMDSLEKLVALYEEHGEISDTELLELTQKISAKTLESQALFSGVDNSDTPQSKRHHLTGLTSFFHDPKLGHDPDMLKNCLLRLEEYYTWFTDKRLHSDLAFVAYCQYICYNRLENFEKAAALDVVYHHLEKQRASISNIHERAGVFNQYPALFGAMAFTNYMSKNVWRLFHRIEASKGRNLADRMLDTAGVQIEMENPDKLKDRLLPVLEKYNAHYLTVLVDIDRSYSVLLTKQGKVFASASGPNEEILNSWLKKDYASPSTWNASIAGFFASKNKTDIPLELGKFIEPIHFAMEEGMMQQGDHIVYSPDHVLNLFSLQIAKLKSGDALIERFTVSKIHSGNQLVKLLNNDPNDLDEIIAITCSAVQDDKEKVRAFEEIPKYLLPDGEDLGEEESVSVENVLAVLGENKLYHFSTHGVFPKAVANASHKQMNPYYNSGLLLMANGQKPALNPSFIYHDGPFLLSPEVLTTSGVNLSGSHISMQACVSGRSSEGYGGDALGLEWALFYCGANSMLSASWDIDIDWSNRLFRKFYDNWIHKEMTIRESHREALLQLKSAAPDQPYPSEYYWAGLSLTGDFR
ncbi:MAG: CHAT domain-containing protein [Mongoliibacter sp.]|uniref:CHAT domain-containing protein n=1 Tax=Mongoliibacter sp. TaxID=2022438 RepID=UPI0012F412AD|nr:CHAT domain-containing protein [Mongoliibacter sp.]TVP52520.1 MAG: CHAT domain-containing protein [Mongoliibacter sp.]